MRKVLSFVLVLSLVLGSFSMAFAATPATGLSDISTSANKTAIQVAYDLGIVTGNPDGTYLPTKAVNRAEFAALITRALNVPDSALAGYTSTSFKDTAGYDWAVKYLAFAETKGIMLGDGQGNAMPGKTITVNEAITMALRAIGYTSNSDRLVGSWPANYVTLAQNLDLYTKVANVATVDKANAAQIVYNLLTVKKVSVNSEGTTNDLTVKPTLLEANLDCTKADQIVTYNESAVIDINPYVGAYATKFFNSDNKIVAIKEKSTFLTGKFNTAKDEFKVGDTTYIIGNATVSSGAITNAALTAPVSTTDAITDAFYLADHTYTLAVDKTNLTIDKIYTVADWVVTYADQADSNTQTEITQDKELWNYAFYKNDDKTIDTSSFVLTGVKSLSDIAKDNVVYVYTLGNGATAKIVKVAVGTQVVNGEVSAFNADNGAKIAGTFYKNNATTINGGSNLDGDNVGDTVKVWLDADGKVFDYETISGVATNYALVTAKSTTSGYITIVKLMSADGANKQYTIDTDEVASIAAGAGQIIKYGLSSTGEIDSVTEDTSLTLAALKYTNLYTTGSINFISKSVALVTAGGTTATYKVNSDAVVFTYSAATSPGAVNAKYDVSNVNNLTLGLSASPAGVFLDKNGNIAALVISTVTADVTTDDLYGVLNTKELTTNADKDKVYRLAGFANGAAFDKLTTSTGKADFVGGSADLDPANISVYHFGLDGNGNINNVVTMSGLLNNNNTGTANASSTGITVKSAGTDYVVASDAGIGTKALAVDVKYYEVSYTDGLIDAFKAFTGSLREGYKVWLYDSDTATDADSTGYDIVVVLK